MSLIVPTTGGGAAILSGSSTLHPYTRALTLRHLTLPRPALHVPSAKKFSSRSGRNRTTTREQEVVDRTAEITRGEGEKIPAVDGAADGYFLPELPGDKPSFWEGEKWDGLGFFVEYLWAFGFLFAIIACGVAVATYNEGATDFKDTPAYKESIQTRELLEGPETSSPDVFESNPTEVAPSLE